MKVAVLQEQNSLECRVAVTPKTVKRLLQLGFDVVIGSGAGLRSGISDEEYSAAGASIVTGENVCTGADVILAVGRPPVNKSLNCKEGALLIGSLDPYSHTGALKDLIKSNKLSCFPMELLPRITRVQGMDVLSSQANLIGYRGFVDAAYEYGKVIPMMITSAGTLLAAKVFVMGVGVAGLQAIATARRFGAMVTATDVRPSAKEQVLSLGAKFIAVEDEEFKQAEAATGYAKPMSPEYLAKQEVLVADHLKNQDIVIAAAFVPGRPAPKLVKKAMLRSMKSGSVVVDLAVERGGNVEDSVAGKVVEVSGVKIIGYDNYASRLASSASQLYAENLYSFLESMVDKEKKTLSPDWEDEVIKAVAVSKNGEVLSSLL